MTTSNKKTVHCSVCNKDVLKTSYRDHLQSKSHIRLDAFQNTLPALPASDIAQYMSTYDSRLGTEIEPDLISKRNRKEQVTAFTPVDQGFEI